MKEKIALSIFTSTYNRASTLGRLYASLQRQTCKNFEWILVDDGSTDETEMIARRWLSEQNAFLMRYFKKENEGFHTGYNVAIAHLCGDLAVCIDSDDYMPDNAVERILSFWAENGSKQYGGILGLDYDLNGVVIGGKLPNQKSISLIDMVWGKYPKSRGDKKYVVRSELYREVAPMKVFPGEKYFNPNYMHTEIGKHYEFLIMNECLCIVDYQPDGMGSNMFRQYKNSPNSFLEIRKQYFSFGKSTLKNEIRNGIHFVSSAVLSQRFRSEFRASDRKPILLLSFLPGLLLAAITQIRG